MCTCIFSEERTEFSEPLLNKWPELWFKAYCLSFNGLCLRVDLVKAQSPRRLNLVNAKAV